MLWKGSQVLVGSRAAFTHVLQYGFNDITKIIWSSSTRYCEVSLEDMDTFNPNQNKTQQNMKRAKFLGSL